MIKKSLAYQAQAKDLIPGVSQLLSKRPDMFTEGVWPGYYSKAKGADVWDLDGNRYIDMSIAGIGANVLGYADDDVNEAVMTAIRNGSSSSLNCPEEVDLAKELCQIHPWAQKVRFARCGGEAMTVAVRLARAFTGRDIVAVCGYHGWHDWYLAANLGTENSLGEHLLPGLNPVGVPQSLKGTTLTFRYNHLEDLKLIIEQHKGKLAAVIMEPIRNITPQPSFLESVKKLAQESGAVFIFDEVSSGFRLTFGGAHLQFGVEPDIAVFSKAIGNGFPIAAIVGRSHVMEAAQNSFISSTMWTERIGPVAALATIKKFRECNVSAHLNKIGQTVQEGWSTLALKHQLNISVGGVYPLSHFKFEYPNYLAAKAFFIQEMLLKGYLTSTTFYSMFAHTDAHVQGYLNAADEVFSRIASHLEANTLECALQGKPSVTGFKRVT